MKGQEQMKPIRELSDFPGFENTQQQIQALRAEKQSVRNQIDALTATLMRPAVDDRSAWARSKDAGFVAEIHVRSSAREELQMAEGREKFLAEAIAGGEKELSSIRGQASPEICKDVRAAFVEQGERVLRGSKEVEKANRELARMRDDLHQRGVQTGTLPFVAYDLGCHWHDPSGGRLVDHQKYIAKNLPELAELALSALVEEK